MNIDSLIATGLTGLQAKAYALLLEAGEVTPPEAAAKLQLSRTNAYKLLDKLVELKLAKKEETHKKLRYYPDNPLALADFVADQRNIASSREDAVRSILKDLLAKYHSHTEQPSVQVISGRDAVAAAYRRQIEQLESIYFVRTRADIPVMGFDAMRDIRIEPARHGVKRFGITPDLSTGTTTSDGDKRSDLARTWVRQEDYTAPVEWSVSGSSLLIVLFGAEPHAITISSPIIAMAFQQLWQIMNQCLQAMPYYKELPRKK